MILHYEFGVGREATIESRFPTQSYAIVRGGCGAKCVWFFWLPLGLQFDYRSFRTHFIHGSTRVVAVAFDVDRFDHQHGFIGIFTLA